MKKKEEILAIVLFWLALLFGAAALVKAGSFFVISARAENLIANTLKENTVDPNELEQYLAKSKELANEIKQKNLFAPPPPKQHPVSQVLGILGSEALINGKWYKVGDKIQNAIIIAIEPTLVKVEWEGKEKTFAPLAAKTTPGPVKKPKPEEKEISSDRKTAPVVIDDQPVEASAEEDPLAWFDLKLTPRVRAKFLEIWNGLSDDKKQQIKQGWASIPAEQKSMIRQQWESMTEDMQIQMLEQMNRQ